MSNQESLEFKIEELNEFYRSGDPRVTDEQYDKLIEELQTNYPNSLLLKKGVVEKPKESRKQKLPIPMFSLNKEKTVEGIKVWLKSNNISEDELLIITPKYDGISLVVNEVNRNAWTRGDGEYGQESKWHFQKIKSSVDRFDMYSFGEAIMSKENFKMYKDEYANPRNMVAGLFNRDITTMPLQHVDYIRYGSSLDIDKNIQIHDCNVLNSTKVPFLVTVLNCLDQQYLDWIYQDWSKDYQIDGLVIDINSAKLRQKLGREENMNPKYARAYKNPEWSSAAIVKVTGVTWQVSKQGKLKPVIQIPPTEVAGVIITNVTGYNAKYILDHGICEGAEIKIIRSGDVIPKHIETISFNNQLRDNMFDKITECPSCGEPTKWDSNMTEIVCLNPKCKEMRISKLVHFFNTVGIENFGEPSIRSIYEEGFTNLYTILGLSEKQLREVEGFGKISCNKLLNQFKNLLDVGLPLAKTIHALDIMNGVIGEKTIQNIFNTLTDKEIFGIIEENRNLKFYQKLLKVDGVSDITATNFIKGMEAFNNTFYDLPISTTYTFKPKQEVVGCKFKNQKLCFTGCRPKDELKNVIESQGGEIVSGVSKNTTILVVKDLSEKTLSSSKAVKAKGLGVNVVTLDSL